MRWIEGPAFITVEMASDLEDDGANVTASVTGAPFNNTDLPGVTEVAIEPVSYDRDSRLWVGP